MRIRVKICGVTNLEAVTAACDSGADAIGFVFAESPRLVTPKHARVLASHVHPLVTKVAVLRHPSRADISRVTDEFSPHLLQFEPSSDGAQTLPGDISLLPVFHDGPEVTSLVFDHIDRTGMSWILLEGTGRGGSGAQPDWDRAAEISRHANLILAGGLSPANVGEAIRTVRPSGVDVSSGVEAELGVKDPRLITDFVNAVREAESVGERI